MHDVLENGTLVQLVISAVERDPPKDRKRPLTREMLTSTLSGWMDGPIAKGVIDVSQQPRLKGSGHALMCRSLYWNNPNPRATRSGSTSRHPHTPRAGSASWATLHTQQRHGRVPERSKHSRMLWSWPRC
jgi:hypothetical protein